MNPSQVLIRQPLNNVQLLKEMVITDLEGEEATLIRLHEMGFIKGSVISLENKTSFNGPLAFRVGQSKIALRHQDAACVFVTDYAA